MMIYLLIFNQKYLTVIKGGWEALTKAVCRKKFSKTGKITEPIEQASTAGNNSLFQNVC